MDQFLNISAPIGQKLSRPSNQVNIEMTTQAIGAVLNGSVIKLVKKRGTYSALSLSYFGFQ